MRKLVVASLLVFAVAPGARADDPIPPGLPGAAAGAIATPNVEFIANIPDILAIGAKIVGTRLYVTTTQGLRIYDVSMGLPVPIGALDLPHFENEAVDTNGEILLIANDGFGLGPHLVYVIDVTIPQAPLIRSVVRVSNAHTATCILDCSYAWTTGGDVIDLTDPANARVVGRAPVGSHNTNVDAAGLAWLGGSTVYDTTTYGPGNLLSPTKVASGNGFGWHNSIRPDANATTAEGLADGDIDPGELVVGTDEDWLAAGNGFCRNDGPFITSWLHRVNGTLRVDRLDTFKIGQGTLPEAKPLGVVSCSSHWLDYRDGIVADAWYEQGVRFLDVSDPRNIRQIGYFMPAVTEAWHATFLDVTEGPTASRYVYVFDYARGLDVLRWVGSSTDAEARAPAVNPMPVAGVRPHPEYGWACRIVAPAA